MNSIRKVFKQRVIELIHGLPYEEAVKKELGFGCIINDNLGLRKRKHIFCGRNLCARCNYIALAYAGKCVEKHFLNTRRQKKGIKIIGLPVTIGRVMQALENRANSECSKYDGGGACDCYHNLYTENIIPLFDIWKLTKENGQECDDSDQSNETINSLYELIKD